MFIKSLSLLPHPINTMNRRFLLSLVIICSVQYAFSQDADSVMLKRISDQILLDGKAYASLRVLCKTVGQRLSGSAGMYKG
jgi:carboxypeptidase Q